MNDCYLLIGLKLRFPASASAVAENQMNISKGYYKNVCSHAYSKFD